MEILTWNTKPVTVGSGEGEARVPRVQDGSVVVEDDPSARCDSMPAVCNPGTWQGKAGILRV